MSLSRSVGTPFTTLIVSGLILTAPAFLGGCDEGIRQSSTPSFSKDGDFQFGKLGIGAPPADEVVNVTNEGSGDLEIRRVRLEVDNSDEEFELYFRFPGGDENRLINRDGTDVGRYPLIIEGSGGQLAFILNYTVQSERIPAGRVVLETNVPTADGSGEFAIDIRVAEGASEITVSPPAHDFGRVAAGDTAEHQFTVTNIGQLPLNIHQILLNGSQDFVPLVDDEGTLKDPRRIDRDIIQTLDPADEMVVTVRYSPQIEGPDSAELSIMSSDERSPEVNVSLTANGATPCLRVSPGALEFRTSLVNRTDSRPLNLESCGGATVTIRRISRSDEADPAFELVPDGVMLPLALAAYSQEDQSAGLAPPSGAVQVEFTPREQRIHNGALIIESDDPTGDLINGTCVNNPDEKCWYRKEVSLLGRGVLNACPQARVAQEEFSVVPLDVVVLDGSPSIDQDGPNSQPVEYEWVVTGRPDGSTSQPRESFFDPAQPANDGPEDDRSTPSAVFFVDLAGTYTIELRVRDNLGLDSIACENPGVVTVVAQPEEAIHVQLVWRTPGDEDETDGEGADLDLHLLHPSAENWGNSQLVEPYDCYYLNPTPDWGQLANSEDDPSLDIDDINGAGPENVSLNNPQDTAVLGAPYLVGVHYYSSHGRQTGFDYGRTFAKLRVYIRGELAWEYEGSEGDELPGEKEMQAEGHFWYVNQINWPSGEVVVRDLYSVTPP